MFDFKSIIRKSGNFAEQPFLKGFGKLKNFSRLKVVIR